MMTRSFFIAFILFIHLPILSNALLAFDYDRYQASVFLLQSYNQNGKSDSKGTGFLINDNIIVTNYHVIDSAYAIELKDTQNNTYAISHILNYDKVNDLAILQLNQPLPNSLHLYENHEPRTGEDIFVIGNPQGLINSLADGIISAYRKDGVPPYHHGPLLQISTPTSPGSSGSPVFNRDGKVIGIQMASLASGQLLNFAIPVSKLHALLKKEAQPALLGSPSLLNKESQSRVFEVFKNLIISFVVFMLLFRILRNIGGDEKKSNKYISNR